MCNLIYFCLFLAAASPWANILLCLSTHSSFLPTFLSPDLWPSSCLSTFCSGSLLTSFTVYTHFIYTSSFTSIWTSSYDPHTWDRTHEFYVSVLGSPRSIRSCTDPSISCNFHFLYSWVEFHFAYLPFHFPGVCWWTSRLVPCTCCWELRSN